MRGSLLTTPIGSKAEFTPLGVACFGLNGGPAFKHSEAFSFRIVTED
jgi:predicted 3-demethylubiquinone-9 3-methyltransferase (glyoxalase superfamily)